jgi:tetratricopeptide (TPR) repeat protein
MVDPVRDQTPPAISGDTPSTPSPGGSSTPSPGVPPTATSVDVTRRFAPGTLVAGRYRIVGIAGVGGMGVVYRARDEELHVDTALKVLRPDLGADPRVLERFRTELRLAREVSHKNVVRIHDIGEHEGLRFLTMRYVEGRSLSEVLEKEGPMPAERAAGIARQVASALEEAHRAGVIHRDLKPGNVLLDRDDVAYVTDFGVARSLGGDGLTRAGTVVGTPDYLSPEQIAGEPVDARTDLYALGIVLFEMLTGQLPFRSGSQAEMLAQRLAGRARDLADVGVRAPRWLAAVIRKLLERSPARRYPSAAAVLEDLDRARAPQSAARSPLAIAIAAAALIAVALSVWTAARHRASAPATTAGASRSRPAAASTREAVAILPLADETADPGLAWTSTGIPEMLAASLSETGDLRILDSLRVLRNLRDLHLAPGRYDEAALRELAELWNAGRLVTGSVRRAGSALRVDLKLVRVGPGGLASRTVSAEAPDPEGLFRVVRDLSQRVRAELGFSSSPAGEKPVATASVDAAKAYETGRQRLLAGDDLGAAPAFEQAVAADPGFAPALERLAETYQSLGRNEKAEAAIDRALAAVGSSESRLAYRVRARNALLQGRPEEAEKHFQELLGRFPFDAEPRLDLAAAQAAQGHNSEAVTTLKKAVEVDPADPRAWFQLGKNSILAGDSARAASDYLVRALALHTRLGNEKGKADVLNAMGVANQQLGEYPRALESYTAAAAARDRIGDDRGLASTMRNRAMVNVSLGRSRAAQADLERARKLFEKIGDKGGLSDVMNDFGLLHEGRGAYARARAAYQDALKIRRGMGDERLLAQSYDNVGYIYYLEGEYDNALVYWKQALDLRRKIGEKNGIVLSVQNMGFLQTAQGKWDEAMKSFVEALEDSRAIGFKNAEAISLGNIATLSAYRGRIGAALDSFSAALALLAPLDLKPALAEFTLKEGAVRLELGQLEEVRTRLAAAEAWLKETENREQAADLETLRGQWHAARGEADPARRAFARAIALAKESGSPATLLHARIASASSAADAGDAGRSAAELSRALNEAQSLGHAVLTMRAAEGLARVELARHRPARAEELSREALLVADRTGWEAGRFRLHALLARALEARGDAPGAKDAWRASAQEARRLEQNVPVTVRPSFLALPDVREALAHQEPKNGKRKTENGSVPGG